MLNSINARKNSTPLVSVVMPAKNEERYIATAIRSILDQTYSHLELIIVDDYSSDGTSDVVRSFQDPRVVLHTKTSEPPGISASRNIAIQLAQGAMIANQDADDCSHPERLELQLEEALQGTGPRVVGSWIEMRIGPSSRIRQLPTSHREIVAGLNRFYDRVTFVSGTIFFPRSLAVATPFRERFPYFEDWDQLCRLSELGTVEFCNIPRPLYTYNIRPKGTKGQANWARFNVFERACRARRHAGLTEWATIDEFETYLRRSPAEFIWWRGVQQLLNVKRQIDMFGVGG
jgi:glycosyltransferase involved in cell wall biosynthesis